MSDNHNWLQEIDQALFGPAIIGTDKDPERTLRRAKEAYAALVKYRGCGCDFGEDKPCPFHGKKPRCTCDDVGDGACPQHGRENELQDKLIAIRNLLPSLPEESRKRIEQCL